jgi:hypothetical protein
VGAAEALGGFQHDRLRHAFGIIVHLAVPEADDRPAFGFECASAALVRGAIDMLTAVDLNDQASLPTSQVCDKPARLRAGA